MPETQDRTEQATPRRRQKAREKGQVARSRELIHMAGITGIILMFYFAGNAFMNKMSTLTGKLLRLQYGKDPFAAMMSASYEMLGILMPFLVIPIVLSLLAGVLQGGTVLRPLTIEIEKLSPINGLKRIFSRNGLIDFLKSLFKFVIGGILFYYIIKKLIFIVPSTTAMDIREIRNISGSLIGYAVMLAYGTFLVFAIVDYINERWRFERSIRMTQAELKEEHKESEGDPIIKSRIKSIQRDLARKRMMQKVSKATVVITNPTHIAVALKYEKNDSPAPKVIAKGRGFIAEKIKEIAEKYSIPIVEDKPLARMLYRLDIDSYIPEELYRAVAKILAYIYKLRGTI